ncbi:MAG: hypothetical protein F4Y61_08100 [Rhodothermaceae bacterium]|nr:hypothetical protein [Rhodothermaceae bacterium]
MEAAIKADPAFARFCAEAIARFSAGDWGDIAPDRAALNETPNSDRHGIYELTAELTARGVGDEGAELWIVRQPDSPDQQPAPVTILWPAEW